MLLQRRLLRLGWRHMLKQNVEEMEKKMKKMKEKEETMKKMEEEKKVALEKTKYKIAQAGIQANQERINAEGAKHRAVKAFRRRLTEHGSAKSVAPMP